MNKGIKKFKIRQGKDHTDAVIRKLVVNFLLHGRLKTTTKRARYVKMLVDRYVMKAKQATSGAQNVLKKKLANNTAIEKLTKEIVPKMGKRTSGFTTFKRIGQRKGDGAEMIIVEWIADLNKKAEPVEKKETNQDETKKTADKKEEVKKDVK